MTGTYQPLRADTVMATAAHRAHPREACGVIIDGVAYEVTNVATDPLHSYVMDLGELEALIDEYGMPEATWHSHPGGAPWPSDADLRHQPPGLRLLVIAGGRVFDHGVVADG